MPVCELKVKFKDSDELVTLKCSRVIRKCPVLAKAMKRHNPKWESTDTILAEPVPIPFSKASGEFLFSNINKYYPPAELELDWHVKAEDYPEANEMTLDELREIIEVANYLEALEFMDCIGFVIARKLEPLSVKEIAEYMGAKYEDKEVTFRGGDGWVHAEPNPNFLYERRQKR